MIALREALERGGIEFIGTPGAAGDGVWLTHALPTTDQVEASLRTQRKRVEA